MNNKYFDYIICGGGASGILLLKALRQDNYFEDQTILIVDKELKSGNDRTWCYWEKPVGEFDSILSQKWDRAQFSSDTHTSEFDLNIDSLEVYWNIFFWLQNELLHLQF